MRWNPRDAVAVVTGASSGIGRCLAYRLLRSGSHLVLVARRSERLAELSSRFEHQVHPVVGDITDPAIRAQVADVAGSLRDGQVDLLVNNAGIGAIGPFADAAPERLRRIMEVNFFAPVELTRLLLPSLRQGRAPVLCNVSSVLGHRGVPNKSEYCASKFALHGWSDSLRAELAGVGIQVTLVSPSTTRSEFFDSLVDTPPDRGSQSSAPQGDGQPSPDQQSPDQQSPDQPSPDQQSPDQQRLGSWSPERVAETAFRAICSRRSEVICSLGGKALVYGDRLAPSLMNELVARFS